MKMFKRIQFFTGGFLAVSLIILIIYGFFSVASNSYKSLYDYHFKIKIQKDFIIDRQLELIDIVHKIANIKNEEDFDEYCGDSTILNMDCSKFIERLSFLEDDKLDNIFKSVWHVLHLPQQLINELSINSKRSFLMNLFSENIAEQYIFDFDFTKEINSLLKKKPHILKDSASFAIIKKFDFSFFNNANKGAKYSVLPSVVSLLWLSIFIIITILTLALFTAFYFYGFVDEDSKFKLIFLKLLSFYQFLPESLLAILSFSFFVLFLEITKNSVLIIGLSFFLIIFPLIVNIIFTILSLLPKILTESFKMSKSKVQFLITNILPVVSPQIIYHMIKILAWITNFGFLFLIFGKQEYLKLAPRGFSNEASSLVGDLFIAINNDQEYVISSIILVLLLINTIFYLLACLSKNLFLSQ